MSITVELADNPTQQCAELLAAAAATGEDMILTGGSTPKAAYELAASTSPQSFAGARLWFSDERCVAPDDPRSNFGMVRDALLEPLAAAGVEVAFCRRILGERGHEEAALEYERELEEVGGGPGAIRFGFALLGIGSDGHICSMFPSQRSLRENARLAVGVPEAGLEPFVSRVTLTFAALNRCRHVVVLATGTGKADAVAAAFAEDAPASEAVPASLLTQHVEQVTVLVDDAAAARL
jgi:6-phosphogluconolactonase